MQISIVNHSNGRVSDEHLQRVIRAINRQIHEDFEPQWGMGGTLRLEGRSSAEPTLVRFPDLRGDSVIYIWNEVDPDKAFGYHEKNARGIPYGFVFTEISQSIDEPWSVTLSHEALELIGDPETNLVVMGPHPSANYNVFHWYEMCDAVQDETYDIDGIAVSNFVLPLYFTGTRRTDEKGGRNDFLGRSYGGQTLESFGINPGGYVGFYDPKLRKDQQFSLRGDVVSRQRMERKNLAKYTRRSARYRNFENRVSLDLSSANGRKRPLKRAVAAAATITDGSITSGGERIYARIESPNAQPANGRRAKRANSGRAINRKPRQRPAKGTRRRK